MKGFSVDIIISGPNINSVFASGDAISQEVGAPEDAGTFSAAPIERDMHWYVATAAEAQALLLRILNLGINSITSASFGEMAEEEDVTPTAS